MAQPIDDNDPPEPQYLVFPVGAQPIDQKQHSYVRGLLEHESDVFRQVLGVVDQQVQTAKWTIVTPEDQHIVTVILLHEYADFPQRLFARFWESATCRQLRKKFPL